MNYGKYILSAVIALTIVGALFLLTGGSASKFGSYQIQQIGGGGGAQPVPALVAATSTPCVIPVTSTSSLSHFAITITTGTSSAGTFALGTSTSAFATSSKPLATFVVPANSQITWTWNNGALTSNDIMSPGTFLVAGMTNGSAVSYGYTYGGYCGAVIYAD